MFSQTLFVKSGGAIQSAAVDPGGVNTRIYRGSALVSCLMKLLCRIGIMATPEEGCQAVVFAATCPWPVLPSPAGNLPETGGRSQAMPMRAPFFARGLFASPLVTYRGSNALMARILRQVLGPVVALLDQPTRWLLCGRLGTSRTYAVAANSQVYERSIGDALWDASSELCGIPAEFGTLT